MILHKQNGIETGYDPSCKSSNDGYNSRRDARVRETVRNACNRQRLSIAGRSAKCQVGSSVGWRPGSSVGEQTTAARKAHECLVYVPGLCVEFTCLVYVSSLCAEFMQTIEPSSH